jgi:cellulose synthase (UDP-forming)
VSDSTAGVTAQRFLATPAVRVGRRLLLRTLAIALLGLGASYLAWRYTSSLNPRFLWFAVPLLIAETYSCIDTWLFALTVWRMQDPRAAPPAPPGLSVDVFITRYDEDPELLRRTVRAASAITYPHRTHVLDDGDSPEVRTMAEEEGAGYITRGEEWRGRPRHAKAGNLSNALMRTDGEFILVLDVDQIPTPAILDRTLGYFHDERVAFVQTPQVFYNVRPGDPLGSQAPLFYGPIQRGKAGWNAAFFCGSNAVIRREALMQAGVIEYVRELKASVRRVLRAADQVFSRAARRARSAGDHGAYQALRELRAAAGEAEQARRRGDPIQDYTYAFQRRVDQVSRRLVTEDAWRIRADLDEIAELAAGPGPDLDAGAPDIDEAALAVLASRDWSPLGALAAVKDMLRAVDVDRAEEAQPVLPISTIAVTEDMATSLRLHALGWTSVYHDEVLARGLAPEDMASAFQQRLRWAQGTIQVLLRQNPLVLKGLTTGQRLMYLGTMWSYLSGFFIVVYIAGPPLYLLFGVVPISSYSQAFFAHLVPYLVTSQVLFTVAGWGKPTWRGQQYSLALFPLWIRAALNAFGNVVLKRQLAFIVTPKVYRPGRRLRLVWPQLLALAVLAVSLVVGLVKLVLGWDANRGAITVNLLWACYLLAVLSVVLRALRVRPG